MELMHGRQVELRTSPVLIPGITMDDREKKGYRRR